MRRIYISTPLCRYMRVFDHLPRERFDLYEGDRFGLKECDPIWPVYKGGLVSRLVRLHTSAWT